MAVGKRGVFFTVIAIVFLTIMYFSVSLQHRYSLREQSFIIGDRVRSVDFFIDDIERDIERGAYIATFRALLGIQQHITSEGSFLNDTDATFEEVLLYGTINGTYLSVMNDTELNVWIARIQSEASRIAISFNYTVNSVRLYQIDPWTVSVDLNVTLNISDDRDTAAWTRDQIISTTVNITSFEDPLYAVYTYGRVINTIQETAVTDYTDGTNTTNLLTHIDGGYYRTSSSGPSYLMRLGGNLSNSTYGIESIVNLKRLEDALLPIEEKTSIDYLYFSNQTPTRYLINNTYNWFRLDNLSGHLARYEVENLTA
jgi:hypothetical protein